MTHTITQVGKYKNFRIVPQFVIPSPVPNECEGACRDPSLRSGRLRRISQPLRGFEMTFFSYGFQTEALPKFFKSSYRYSHHFTTLYSALIINLNTLFVFTPGG